MDTFIISPKKTSILLFLVLPFFNIVELRRTIFLTNIIIEENQSTVVPPAVEIGSHSASHHRQRGWRERYLLE